MEGWWCWWWLASMVNMVVHCTFWFGLGFLGMALRSVPWCRSIVWFVYQSHRPKSRWTIIIRVSSMNSKKLVRHLLQVYVKSCFRLVLWSYSLPRQRRPCRSIKLGNLVPWTLRNSMGVSIWLTFGWTNSCIKRCRSRWPSFQKWSSIMRRSLPRMDLNRWFRH